jgi:hypothetical protein
MRAFTLAMLCLAVSPIAAVAAGVTGYVARFAPDGTLVNWFDAGLIGDQGIVSLDIDRDGNVWVGRQDAIHGPFPNPNDKIVKHSPTGVALLTVKGPMAQPQAIALDANGNLYVAGEFEASDDSAIFKYDPAGSFLMSFDSPIASQPDIWQDLVITSDDRIFAGGDLSGTIAEYSTNGTQANLINFGVLRRIWGLALNNDHSRIWSLDLANGPGTDRINQHDLQLSAISSFPTGAVDPPWDNLQNGSIEFSPDGKLYVGASTFGPFEIPVAHEISEVDGAIVNTIQFPAINDLVGPNVGLVNVNAFTMDRDGNFVFGFETRMAIPEPASWLLAILTFCFVRKTKR